MQTRRGGGNRTGQGSRAAPFTTTGLSHDKLSAVHELLDVLVIKCDCLSASCFAIQGNLGVSCWEFKFMPEKRVLVLGNLNAQAGQANTVHGVSSSHCHVYLMGCAAPGQQDLTVGSCCLDMKWVPFTWPTGADYQGNAGHTEAGQTWGCDAQTACIGVPGLSEPGRHGSGRGRRRQGQRSAATSSALASAEFDQGTYMR